ncbi:MAG: hypothetical protein IKB97_08070, partial [Bacteroidaceae bacterium]|nr:hypothetical protein [Bacteroidaceae bacterium]
AIDYHLLPFLDTQVPLVPEEKVGSFLKKKSEFIKFFSELVKTRSLRRIIKSELGKTSSEIFAESRRFFDRK